MKRLPQNKNQFKKIVSSLTLISLLLIPFAPTHARFFYPNNIITDNDLHDYNSLSQTAIQTFLERENSVLAGFTDIVNGVTKKASEIIWEVARIHQINPKFLLATLEKEQGLIAKSEATQKQLDWATGYGCYGGQCNSKYKGFFHQVESSAITQNIYTERAGQFGFRVGVTTQSFDGVAVTPENQATANLYIYTPYVGGTSGIGGNHFFWRIWNQYFTDQKYPDGLVLQHAGNYYLVEKSKLRKFVSREIFLKDYSESDAYDVSAKTIAAYPAGAPIEFAKNTLVKSAETNQNFLLADYSTKRAILDDAALALLIDFHLAVAGNEIPLIANAKIGAYQDGTPITVDSKYPQGQLVKDETGQIWWLQDKIKHPVDPLVWQVNYKSQTPDGISAAAIADYLESTPIRFKSGIFVKTSDDRYYIISEGDRMRIATTDTLARVFGADKLQSAIAISDDLLSIHGAGYMIDFIDETIAQATPISTPPEPTGQFPGYHGEIIDIETENLILLQGDEAVVKVTAENTGNITWPKGEVWMQLANQGGQSSLFINAQNTFNFNESEVPPGETATFNVPVTAPQDLGHLGQSFRLQSAEGTHAQINKIFIVKPLNGSGLVVKHNLPQKIDNTARPTTITFEIVNKTTGTTWLSSKTALEIYNADGSESPFYDPNDWIRSEVAAVPLNQSRVAPGETGIFKFTLDARNVLAGEYLMKIRLRLLDQNGLVIPLNNVPAWFVPITVE
ncbi:MAG: hypothetical protein COT81_05420 [Candidatus Buchananbacteria bacterium CG10_big_fil_rev_8_21_14_0_10_42_9]|uniref:Nbr1 FW domain-containing protein n=1 Tax=Candidatus Buchananbacteria bacterium CG10_big_fil_rev_8_21_14_0_10_42_9 TaxID=1974526 RepID=A0A2H0VZW0_9BACT|nr:MAG: hypothetical protein COT81_05420 [Candidatus Buchananbacteria bacterium CG10_big_fil_rev_8_21_14_0_10_42_9]